MVISVSQTWLLFNWQFFGQYLNYYIQTWHDGRLMHGRELDLGFENVWKALLVLFSCTFSAKRLPQYVPWAWWTLGQRSTLKIDSHHHHCTYNLLIWIGFVFLAVVYVFLGFSLCCFLATLIKELKEVHMNLGSQLLYFILLWTTVTYGSSWFLTIIKWLLIFFRERKGDGGRVDVLWNPLKTKLLYGKILL